MSWPKKGELLKAAPLFAASILYVSLFDKDRHSRHRSNPKNVACPLSTGSFCRRGWRFRTYTRMRQLHLNVWFIHARVWKLLVCTGKTILGIAKVCQPHIYEFGGKFSVVKSRANLLCALLPLKMTSVLEVQLAKTKCSTQLYKQKATCNLPRFFVSCLGRSKPPKKNIVTR